MVNEPMSVAGVRRTIRSRRLRSLVFSIAVTAIMAVVSSADLQSVAIVAPSLVLATMLVLRADEDPHTGLLAVTYLVAVPTLVWAALTGSNAVGSVAFAVAAGITIEAKTVHRGRWVLAAFIGSVLLSSLAFTTDSPNALGTMLQLSLVAGLWLMTIVDIGSEQRLFGLLEQAKDTERELSLTRERNRFAADLHDIQGHTLHVIKLKAAVAAKLQHTDAERTAEELVAIQQLTADTIQQARHLANATQHLSLTAELEHAVQLLKSAGISHTVNHNDSDLTRDQDGLLARTLRESITNIMRHARPRHVQITIHNKMLQVTNDGASQVEAPLRGLEVLRNRVEVSGGTMTIAQDPPRFILTVDLGATL